MKIIILHGEDTGKSFERLKKFVETARSRSWEISNLGESDQTLQENLSSPSLFGAERFFILRDIKRLGKKETEWIGKNYTNLLGNLVIYNEGEIGQTLLKGLPKDSKIEEFKLPKIIWSFLDSLRPGGAITSIKSFHKVIERTPPEFVFSLISKLFRDLYWAKVDAKSMLYPNWRISKLKSQNSKFSEEKLKEIISKLAEIDVDVKTGRADLVSSLDLFMLKHLE